jgi:hypothetical protein
MLWPSVDRPCGQSAPDATTPLRFVASAGIGLESQPDLSFS